MGLNSVFISQSIRVGAYKLHTYMSCSSIAPVLLQSFCIPGFRIPEQVKPVVQYIIISPVQILRACCMSRVLSLILLTLCSVYIWFARSRWLLKIFLNFTCYSSVLTSSLLSFLLFVGLLCLSGGMEKKKRDMLL